MPLPIVIGAAGLVQGLFFALRSKWTWMSIGALMAQGPDIVDSVKKWIVAEAAERAGLALDPEDPLSDASVSNAVSQRIGIPLRSVKSREMVEEDVDTWAAGMLSEKIGYQVSSLRDPARARADLEAAALNIITARTGIPFAAGQGLSPDEIRDAVETWARARLAVEMAGSAESAKAILGGAGVDFEALAAEMNGKLVALGSVNNVSAGQLALHVAESMVKTSVERLQVVATGSTKKSRRTLQLRAAQERFRSLHGNRQVYVPLGMVGTVG